jgi:hypothetical protein
VTDQNSLPAAGLLLACLALISGCETGPPPRAVFEDGLTSVRIQQDPQAGSGHSHPIILTNEQMARILSGVRVRKDRYAVHRLIAGEGETGPAFHAEEALALAPQLVKALAAAKPGELVTFYRRSSSGSGPAYTTGGLFMHGHWLYVVLANYRQMSSDAMSLGIPAYEIDPVDSPLLPLRRAGYTVSFTPQEAEVHPVEGQWTWDFSDPGKILIVDPALVLRSPKDKADHPPKQ